MQEIYQITSASFICTSGRDSRLIYWRSLSPPMAAFASLFKLMTPLGRLPAMLPVMADRVAKIVFSFSDDVLALVVAVHRMDRDHASGEEKHA